VAILRVVRPTLHLFSTPPDLATADFLFPFHALLTMDTKTKALVVGAVAVAAAAGAALVWKLKPAEPVAAPDTLEAVRLAQRRSEGCGCGGLLPCAIACRLTPLPVAGIVWWLGLCLACLLHTQAVDALETMKAHALDALRGDLGRVFDNIDTNGDGVVDAAELAAALKTEGGQALVRRINRLYWQVGLNATDLFEMLMGTGNPGSISRKQFVSAFGTHVKLAEVGHVAQNSSWWCR